VKSKISIESFAKGLLATTCLTVAAGSTAIAGTITEGTGPAPADFSNVANGFQLPVGTTQVFGSLTGEGVDPADWFEFTGLTPGASFTLTGGYPTSGAELGILMSLFTDGGTLLASHTLETALGGGAFSFSGNVPGEGKLDVQLQFKNVEGEGGSEIFPGGPNPSNYVVNLSTGSVEGAATPEPSTMGLAGAGMAIGASALAWRRRRQKQ
jgi:hypothetical protein